MFGGVSIYVFTSKKSTYYNPQALQRTLSSADLLQSGVEVASQLLHTGGFSSVMAELEEGDNDVVVDVDVELWLFFLVDADADVDDREL